MIFGKSRLELKVGIFVFIGIVILTTFVLLIGKFETWTAGYYVNFIFNFVNGVKIGAPVRFAGVDVGEVKKIRFVSAPQDPKLKVKIECWVKNDIKIPSDSTVCVNTLGLLGEKYIEIIPGLDNVKIISGGEELTGKDPIPMHEVTTLAKNLTDNLNTTITKIKSGEGTIGRLLTDDKIYQELEALVVDLRKHPWKLFWKTKEKSDKK